MLSSDDLAFFAVISASTSLAAAARTLGVTPPAVTQRLNSLEARAGVRLVDRSSRHMGLTDEGTIVRAFGSIVGGALSELNEELRDRSAVVSGHLRVAAPHGFGRTYIAPIVASFGRDHPRVTATLDLLDHPSARMAGAYDLAIHIGSPGPMDAIVTTLAENQRFICASPSYLDGSAPLRSPDDLRNHRVLVLRENDEDGTLWPLRRGNRMASVRIKPVISSNDGTVVRDWALAGLGIVIRSEWDVAADLVCGKLRRVLPDWSLPAADVITMIGARQGRSARTSAFLVELRKSFDPPPWRNVGA